MSVKTSTGFFLNRIQYRITFDSEENLNNSTEVSCKEEFDNNYSTDKTEIDEISDQEYKENIDES